MGNQESFDSIGYWEKRYRNNGNSGAGSYGRLANFKAEVINDFYKYKNISEVIEFGVGDGNNLSLYKFNNYTGYDISHTILNKTRVRFQNNKNYFFRHTSQYNNEKAQLTLSLDVIYHLVELNDFEEYIQRLFSASTHYVIIYSVNTDEELFPGATHIKFRRFMEYISNNINNFYLFYCLKNRYPYNIANSKDTSACDFFFYSNNKDESMPNLLKLKYFFKNICAKKLSILL